MYQFSLQLYNYSCAIKHLLISLNLFFFVGGLYCSVTAESFPRCKIHKDCAYTHFHWCKHIRGDDSYASLECYASVRQVNFGSRALVYC